MDRETFPSIRRSTSTLLRVAAPLLIVAACSSSPNSDVTAIDSSSNRVGSTLPTPSIPTTTTAEQQGGSSDPNCAGYPGLDSLTTGESIMIGDDVTVESYVEHYPEGGTVVTHFISDEMALAEGWEPVGNIPDGSHPDSLDIIDQLQCEHGLANVTTGNAIDLATNQASGMPGEISVWTRDSTFTDPRL